MGIKHKHTGLGTYVLPEIWEEEHTLEGHIIPDVTETYDLGSLTKRWQNLYAKTVTADDILGVSRLTYEKQMFFDVDGKSYTPDDVNFGEEEKGGSSSTGNNILQGSKFTAASAGTPQSITAYLKQYLTYTPTVAMAIYRVSDNKLMANTGNWTLTAAWDDWKTLDITNVVENLAAGIEYWIISWNRSGQYYFYYTSGASGQGCYHSKSTAGFPDPLTPTTNTNLFSIYATYTPVVYDEILATRVKVANDYIKPAYARIIARANGDEAGEKKLKIHDGNADVAEVTWSGSGATDLVSDWVEYTDETDRVMRVYYTKSSGTETFTLYNVALEMRR